MPAPHILRKQLKYLSPINGETQTSTAVSKSPAQRGTILLLIKQRFLLQPGSLQSYRTRGVTGSQRFVSNKPFLIPVSSRDSQKHNISENPETVNIYTNSVSVILKATFTKMLLKKQRVVIMDLRHIIHTTKSVKGRDEFSFEYISILCKA